MTGLSAHSCPAASRTCAASPPCWGHPGQNPGMGTRLVTVDDVAAAAVRIAGTCTRTPLLTVDDGDPADPLRLKPESLQPTGAFKLRGATNAIRSLTHDQLAHGVVTHSSGNHAQAVAHAARAVGVRATVVMPDDAAEVKVLATVRLGARVVRVPVQERAAACDEIAAETGAAIIPPYDDARVIAGQGTVGLEVVADLPDLACVLVPVGGGGLISGVAVAVKSLRPKALVVGVEPVLAGDLAAGFAVGVRQTWPASATSRTLADGLRATAVGDLPWAHIHDLVDDVVTVTEDQIVDAVRWLARDARLVSEPSGAVAAAAWLAVPGLRGAGRTVAVVSGGNVDPRWFGEVVADPEG